MMLFFGAGLLEIGGGYLVWLWLREHRPLWFGIAGLVGLGVYGIVPTFQPVENSFGRIYAVYGAVFIVLSMFWGWWIDGKTPDTRDWMGAAVCILGACLMFWPRVNAHS